MGIRGRVKRLHAHTPAGDGKKKKKWKLPFRLNLTSGAFLLASVFVGGFFLQQIAKSLVESVDLYQQNLKLEARIDDLYYEKQMLVEQEKDPLSNVEIERLAKEQLGLLKPGEELIVLKDIN